MGMESSGVKFYQKVLSKNLANHCRWLPNDSRNAQWLNGECGLWRMAPKAMARFINEPEAYKLGYGIVVEGERVYFENYIQSCSFF